MTKKIAVTLAEAEVLLQGLAAKICDREVGRPGELAKEKVVLAAIELRVRRAKTRTKRLPTLRATPGPCGHLRCAAARRVNAGR